MPFSNLDNKKDSKSIAILIGDSRASQWPSRFLSRDFHITNLGFPGATTFEVFCLLKNMEIIPSSDIYIVLLGINDLTAISMIPAKQKKTELERTLNNLLEIVNLLKKTNSRIILTTIVPPLKQNFIRRLIWGNEVHELAASLSKSIVEINEKQVYPLDIRDVFYDFSIKKWRIDLANGVLHWNELGYQVLSEVIKELIDIEMSTSDFIAPLNNHTKRQPTRENGLK